MRRTRPTFIMILACGAVVLATVLALLHTRPTAATLAPYPFPANAPQLIAAGLTGVPAAGSRSAPVTADRVLVDGGQTVVQYHVDHLAGDSNLGWQSPWIDLQDEHGRRYQPQRGGMTGPGIAPSGPLGIIWDVLHPFDRPRLTQGFSSFNSLSPSTRLAVLRIRYGGELQLVRVPLNLAALRAATTTVALRGSAAGNGVVVRLGQVIRGPASARLAYTVDTPIYGMSARLGLMMPIVQDTISDPRGKVPVRTGGSGNCGAPSRVGARMHCDEVWHFAPPPRGTRLTLTVTLLKPPPGRGQLPFGPWRVSFTMP